MISTMMVPPGGWVFYEGNQRIEEQTFASLVNAVVMHRKNNHLPDGDPVSEIKSQICSKYPSTCINQGKSLNSTPSIWDRFKNFANSMLRHYILQGGHLLDQNTANIRAEICNGCHNNQKSDKECKTCGGFVEDAATGVLRAALIQNRNVPRGTNLKSCSVCGCDIKTIVWFPSATLGTTQENMNAYPAFCWRKDLNT